VRLIILGSSRVGLVFPGSSRVGLVPDKVSVGCMTSILGGGQGHDRDGTEAEEENQGST